MQWTEERVVTRVRHDPFDETELDNRRWTPCFDCGVCPQMGTEIEIGPTRKTLLPLTVLASGSQELLEHQHSASSGERAAVSPATGVAGLTFRG